MVLHGLSYLNTPSKELPLQLHRGQNNHSNLEKNNIYIIIYIYLHIFTLLILTAPYSVYSRIDHITTRALVAGRQNVHGTPPRRGPQAAPHGGAQPCHGGRGGARAEGRAAPARRSRALWEGHCAAQRVVATG